VHKVLGKKRKRKLLTRKRPSLRLRIFLVVVVFLIAVLVMIAISSPFNPVSSVFKTIGFVVTGRLHFPKQRIGEVVIDEDGRQFTIFREVVVDRAKTQPEHPGAVLTLHFKVTNMSPAANKFYSLLPLPLYIGDPGFRSKLFTINGEYCQSIYEWDTVQDAENYVNSIALKTILRRAVSGSVSCKIESRAR
jgi:DNA-binding transcriptional regulator of glucitol operon